MKVWAAILLIMIPAAFCVELPLRTYTTADGLPRDAASCIVPDTKGFIWLCTNEGLARFDGETFDVFGVAQGLPNRVVHAFLETRNGMMLAATNQGLARLDPTAAPGSARQFVFIPPADGASSRRVDSLFEDASGAVWAGTLGGIYRIEITGRKTEHLVFLSLGNPALLVQSFAGDGSGGLWIGTNLGLCHRSPAGRIEWFAGGETSPGPEAINALLTDNQGRLWVGTYNGLWLLRNSANANGSSVFQPFGATDGLASERIHSLFQSARGTLWVGMALGLAELRAESGGSLKFRSYGSVEGLRGRVVLAIHESRDGSLWVGVDHGLAHFARNGFLRYGEADGMGALGITAFTKDLDGRLYAVSNEPRGPQLHRIEASGFTTIRPAYPPALQGSGWGLEQIALVDRQGEWWFGTGEGLIRFPAVRNAGDLPRTKPRAFYTGKNGLPSNAVLRIFEDSSGRIWISTLGGLSVWSKATGVFQNFAHQEIPGFVSAFAEDRAGDVWIAASAEAGIGQKSKLFRFRQGQIRQITGSGIPDSWIATMFVDHAGHLWIGSSDNGLTYVDDPASQEVGFENYGASHGLSSTGVSAIAEDRSGQIYAATPQGIDLILPPRGKIHHYSSSEGLPPSAVAAMTIDRQGRLWVGTAMGLASLEPTRDAPVGPGSVVIKSVSVNGIYQTLGKRERGGLDFAPGDNHLQIQFAAPGAPASERPRYQYRLTASELGWSQPSSGRSVDYSNLPPGLYHFQVRSVLPGDAPGVPAQLDFTIQPHFWQRWGFQLAIAIAIVALGFAWHRYDLQRRLEIERVRARIAADLHDDLGADLTRMIILSEVAQRHNGSLDPQVGRHLMEIADRARGLAGGMSDLVWSIDPLRDGIPALLDRLREFASGLLEPQGIAWSLDLEPSARELSFTPDQRWQLFLVLKEAINNAARHASCKNITITFVAAGGWATVAIADDGCGMGKKETAEEAGNGLTNMRKRARSLSGDLSVKSPPGAGVRIELSFPVAPSVRQTKWARGA